jgi:hypothetical protein
MNGEQLNIYIDSSHQDFERLVKLVEDNNFQVCDEMESKLCIRNGDKDSSPSVYEIFNDNCLKGKLQKTIFLSFKDRNWLREFSANSNLFHPKNTSGLERLFLFDEALCLHINLPISDNEILEKINLLLNS